LATRWETGAAHYVWDQDTELGWNVVRRTKADCRPPCRHGGVQPLDWVGRRWNPRTAPRASQHFDRPGDSGAWGRVVNTGGDSLLIVFDSVDGAVRCAIKVQQQVPVCDGDRHPDRTIRFRIGINVGDVIPDGTDVHGEVVNVVTRLQAECPPGGICVSRAVRDHVQDRLGPAFEKLGALNLKNIARPVEAFLVMQDSDATTPKTVERSLVDSTRKLLPLPGETLNCGIGVQQHERRPGAGVFLGRDRRRHHN
jgi:class 3 adenylate cyclase